MKHKTTEEPFPAPATASLASVHADNAYPLAADSTGGGDPDVVQEYKENEELLEEGSNEQEQENPTGNFTAPEGNLETEFFRNKNVILMEVGSEIGATLAENLAVLGARLFLCSSDASQLDAVFETIRCCCPETYVKGISLDLLKKENIIKALNEAQAELGSVDIMINNALPDDPNLYSESQSLENLTAYFGSAFTALSTMETQSSAIILHIVPLQETNATSTSLTTAISTFAYALTEEVDPLKIRISVLVPEIRVADTSPPTVESDPTIAGTIARTALFSITHPNSPALTRFTIQPMNE